MSGSMYSVRDIADQLGKSERWVRKLCSLGKLKAVKLGHSWVILEAVKWLQH